MTTSYSKKKNVQKPVENINKGSYPFISEQDFQRQNSSLAIAISKLPDISRQRSIIVPRKNLELVDHGKTESDQSSDDSTLTWDEEPSSDMSDGETSSTTSPSSKSLQNTIDGPEMCLNTKKPRCKCRTCNSDGSWTYSTSSQVNPLQDKSFGIGQKKEGQERVLSLDTPPQSWEGL